MLLVRLLGPVDVVDGSGTGHALGSALRRTLLALLAMHAGEVLSADWLLEHAWGGEPPESGLRALRFHISRLRRELGEDDLIETHSGGYRLAMSADQIDALAVEARAQAARGEGDPRIAADMYAEVLAMWRGSPFVDAAPCPLLDDEAGRLSELRLTITEDLFECRLDAGAGRELVADLSRLTTRHPLRESLWSMLITAQYRGGLQADALRSYEQMRVMFADSLGLDPSSELQDLQRRVLQHDPSLLGDVTAGVVAPGGSTSRGGNLPAPATSLIDSDDRLGVTRKLLQDHRLVTLTGTGGVGKTRLVVELGWACLDQFDAGVWLVELAPVPNADAVVPAIASTLSVRPRQGLTVSESILDWFRGRELLLIIDNCEHVLDPVRQLLMAVLSRCPTIKVVATSREPLALAGERVYPVNVLNPELDGVALFLERAAAADNSFAVDDVERDVVTDICRRLDGLPLAIELAAARVRSMAPVDLLARLDDRFRVLRGVSRDSPGRHDTLRATVEWSYQLLTEDERLSFDRASVFAGGFDLHAAETVCGFDPIDSVDVIDLVSSLVDKSMIVADRVAVGMRYRLLETLRQYGEDQMELRGETAPLRDRHAAHYADLIGELDLLARGAHQIESEQRMSREWDNLRAAHLWSLAQDELDLAERLVEGSFQYAYFSARHEHAAMVQRTVQLGDECGRPSTTMLGMLSDWAEVQGDIKESRRLAQRALDVAPSLDHPATVTCWGTLAAHVAQGSPESLAAFQHQVAAVANTPDLDRNWLALASLTDASQNADPTATPALRQQLGEIAARVQSPRLMALAHHYEGNACLTASPPDFASAITAYERVAEITRATGELHMQAVALRCLAMASTGLGAPDALARCHDALDALSEIRLWQKIWQVLESVALALATAGRTEQAAVILGHLDAQGSGSGIEHDDLCFRDLARELVEADGGNNASKLRGARMSADELVTNALAYCSAN